MGISLVREHSEAMRPPRALWVPFPLGRPLGAPGDPAFQRDVLLAALGLLERPAGPVLEDFPQDAPAAAPGAASGAEPGADGDELPDAGGILACPVPARGAAGGAPSLRDLLLAEIAFLRPWHDEAMRIAGGRTTVGLSGSTPEAAAELLADFAEGGTVAAGALKLALDDLRAYCLEAGAAQPGAAAAGPARLERWYWWETQVGKALRAAHPRAVESDDPALRMVGKVLMIPVAQRDS